jgi:peptidylprolyl isomerase
VSPATQQRKTKAELRAAAKAKAIRRRRRQAMAGAVGGVAAVAIVVTMLVLVVRSRDDGGTPDAAPAPSATADADAGAQPDADPGANAGEVPPLPPGADPALKTKPVVEKGAGELTKLTVTPQIEGTGPAVAAGQTITVNYVGVSYRTGKEFDASWKTGQPASFPIGVGRVIPGWDQGLVGVKVGSRVQLDIPSDLAYGDNPGGGAPAGPLRFVVDVLAVQ